MSSSKTKAWKDARRLLSSGGNLVKWEEVLIEVDCVIKFLFSAETLNTIL